MKEMGYPDFSAEELQRYSRHFVLPGFGEVAQSKLKTARVAVVGAGGLGCPVLLYLAAAGVGYIRIIDDDRVTVSNLQRQILYTSTDLNQSKAELATKKILQLNPQLKSESHQLRITAENALTLLRDVDVVVDCTDNFPTRYLLNDACVLLNLPLVYGSIFRYEGQVAVFNYRGGVTYRDFYPQPPAPDSVPNCEEGGVLGVLPGLIGTLQANEVLKIISGYAEPLSGQILLFDTTTLEAIKIKVPDRKSRESVKKLIDYDEFCNLTGPVKNPRMKEVTVQELKEMMDKNAEFQLIDVREPHEYEICNLGGELIPQGEIPQAVSRISKDKQVILQCRSGARSGNMVQWLEKNHGFTNLYNLKGGILAWSREIDPSVPTY
jgi:sulfur-carrier protein adenylyltransferase/sulfurtransferase